MYISSSSVKHPWIKDSVKELVSHGFKSIELSGGTQFYPEMEGDLLRLKNEFGLHFLVHNYFPPPIEDFILNLSSVNPRIFDASLSHCQKALELSQKLGGDKFGVHAGFLMDFSLSEIGKPIALTTLMDRTEAIDRFCKAYERLKKNAGSVEIYIENNVLSRPNFDTYKGQNPFLLTDHHGYLELKQHIDYKLLLDVAHLNVSAHSLGLDFRQQLQRLVPLSDYIHLSNNDGVQDQNKAFDSGSAILNALKDFDLSSKTLTLEVYGEINDVKNSYKMLNTLLERTT